MYAPRASRVVVACLCVAIVSASLPVSLPLPLLAPQAAAAAGETLASPRFVSAALLPSGQVGLLFANYQNTQGEIRFKRYTAEHGLEPSQQLSTAFPSYPQLATFQGKVVAGYVDTRAPNAGKLIFRLSSDSGATWAAESTPFGAETFDQSHSAPRVVAANDGQTLYLFHWSGTGVPQYRTSTDPTLVTWTSAAAAGDGTMVVPGGNNCGSSGQECYRAHTFGFMETATPGIWVYLAKSPSGFAQSGRGTQVGTLGGSWSPQVDHLGSGNLSGCCGHSTATTFLDRAGDVYFVRAESYGEWLYYKKSSDGGYTWGPPVYALTAVQPNYTFGAPVGLYVPGYSRGEYVWFAGWGGSEDTLRVIPLWAAPQSLEDSGLVRLFGSQGGDLDSGAAYSYTFGARDLATGPGTFKTSAEDLALPGRLLPLSFVRWYNSADPERGPLGPGWTHSFNWRVRENPGAYGQRATGAGTTVSSPSSWAGSPESPSPATDRLDGTFWRSAVPAGGQSLVVDLEREQGPNLARFPAGATASYSAIEQYSNDFLPQNAANGIKNNTGLPGVDWAAIGWSAGDWWRVTWSSAQSLTRVRLWDHWTSGDYFGSGRLRFSDGSSVSWSGLPNDPGPNGEYFLDITFPRKTGITWLEVVSDAGGLGNAGLSEVEAYDDLGATRSRAANLVRLPAGATASYSAIEQFSADYQPGNAANGAKGSGSGAGVSWAAVGWSPGDWWRVSWSAAQALTRVRLRDRSPSGEGFGTSGRLRFSDATELSWSGLPDDPGANGANFLELSFARKTAITWLEVVSDAGGTGNAGLSEVEAYDDQSPPAWSIEGYRLLQSDPTDCLLGPNLARFPAGGATASYTAIEQYSADHQPAYAANGVKNNSGAVATDWAAIGWSAGDWWRVSWSVGQSLTRVRLWDHWINPDYFGSGRLRFSDGSSVSWSGLPNDAGANGENFLEITFARKTAITWLEVVSDAGGLGNAGLSEVEAYDETTPPVAITAYKVQSSTDAVTWADRHTASAVTEGESGAVRFTGAASSDRYWRLLATAGSTSCAAEVKSFELLDFAAPGGTAEVRRGDGRKDSYTRNADGSYTPPPGVFDTLARGADGSFSLTTKAQVVYAFAQSGRLTKMSEPAGNQITLGYGGQDLSTVTDAVGRVVTLIYDGSHRLVELRDPAGGKVLYTYDAKGRLALVRDRKQSTLPNTAYRDAVMADNPVSYWRLEESSGATAADERAANAGTIEAGASYAQAGIVAGGAAMGFPKAGAVRVPDAASLDFGTGNFTLEFWALRTGSGQQDYPVLLSKRAWAAANEPGWAVSFVGASPDKLALHLNNKDVTTEQSAAGALPLNDWTHVVLTYTAADRTPRLYVNGALFSTFAQTDGLSVDNAVAVYLARDGVGTDRRHEGRLDEVALYNSALSTTRIAAHYNAAPPSWRYAYDGSSSRIKTLTDPDGRVRLSNAYDASGRLSEQKDGLSNPTTYVYGASQTQLTDARANTTTQSFDSRFRLIGDSIVVSGATLTRSFTYDTAGNLTSATDRRGNRTDFTYDGRGNVLTRTDPQINPQTPRYLTSYVYDAKNNLTQLTDPKGFIATHTYDAAKNVRLSTSAQIAGSTYAVTKWEYADAANPGMPTRLIAPRGNTTGTPDYAFATTFAHSSGNLVEEITPDSAKTTHAYDSLGRRTSTVDAEGYAPGGVPAEHTWTTTYDELDRITRETDPLGRFTQFAYDGASNRTSTTDKNGNVTTSTYDAAGRLRTVQQKPDPVGQPTLVYTTTLDRDAVGNVTKVTQGNGVVTDYAYDALDRLTSFTAHPASGTNLVTSYLLDGSGNVTRRTTADGVATNYAYDAMDRLSEISATGLSTITYAYDERSQRTSMADGTGSTTYAYDGLGRTTSAATPLGTISYAYDLDSNRTSLTYPGTGGGTATSAYSNGGRLNTVTDWSSRVSTYTYTATGRAKTLAVPGGVTTTYGYDRVQRLTSLTNVVGSNTITSHSYTLDNEGNRTALSEFVSGITPQGQSDSFGFSYDGLNRLTSVTTTNPESFTLDGASNITSRTGPSATYSIDLENRVTSDGTRSFSWSDADRLMARGADSFGYDPLDRLTSSTVSGTSRSYAYDGDGLVRSLSEAGGTASLLWDAASVPARLLQVDADRVIYGLGPLYYALAGGGTLALARDGLKSVRAEVNGSGSLAASFRYRAYGELAQSYGAPLPSLLGYAGQALDSSGLYYMRARWYDPATGRFLSRDPLSGSPQVPLSTNSYMYAAGNPARFTDPTGECAFLCVVLLVWAGVELGLIGADAISTAETLADPEATELEKSLSVGLFVAGIKTPGGGGPTVVRGARNLFRVETHHLLPQQFKAQFERAGLDIEEFRMTMTAGQHRLRPEGLHTGPESWNKRWAQFFEENPAAGRDEILSFLARVKGEFGID